MTILIENPVPIFLVGVVAVAILGIVFFNTQRGIFLLAIGGVILLTLLGLGIEYLVVTDREKIEAALYGLADAMEANKKDTAIAHLSPSAIKTRTRAEWAFGRFIVEQTNISNLKIDVNNLTSPPSAKARFTCFIRLTDKKKRAPYHAGGGTMTIDYRKEDDRWLIIGHKEDWGSFSWSSDQ